MTAPKPFTVEQVVLAREYLEVDPTSPSGLRWKKQRNSRAMVGYVAGNMNEFGYWRVRIGRKQLFAQRIIFLLATGRDPYPFTIDHIDRDKTNNRIENYRVATPKMQGENRGYSQRSQRGSGLKWVHARPDGKYRGSFSCEGKTYGTPSRSTEEQAFQDVLAKRAEMGLSGPRTHFSRRR